MNEINVRLRQEQLRDLQRYVKDIDKDITLILQSLQWDKKHLLQGEKMVTCKFDSNHRILAGNVKEHEEKCYLKSQNYLPGELFFPEPLDAKAVTVVKLSAENINDIISYAVQTDPSFKRNGSESGGHDAPLTLGRLQASHSADERRALYDAVVAAAPPRAARDPLDRDLTTDAPATTSARGESRSDALLALRDARRRRVRHRGAARDGYQDELRGLISAQMESFTGKWNDEDTDTKPDVRIDESDDGHRCGHGSDRRDNARSNGGSRLSNNSRANRNEHAESREDKRRDNKREDKRRVYNRENKTREYTRESRDDRRRNYETESREEKRREYERDSREDKRREYDYDKKYKEKYKLYEHDDRRSRQYDKEYSEKKQGKDGYASDRTKRKERSYECEQDTDKSSSKINKKYHKRDERCHKQKSAERREDGSGDRQYNRDYKSDINYSYLKIKKEPPGYD